MYEFLLSRSLYSHLFISFVLPCHTLLRLTLFLFSVLVLLQASLFSHVICFTCLFHSKKEGRRGTKKALDWTGRDQLFFFVDTDLSLILFIGFVSWILR